MAIKSAQQRENLAIYYGTVAMYVAATTTAPGSTTGTEVSGGSPAYARKPVTWAAGSVDGVITGSVVLDIPASTNVRGIEVFSALTGGTYLDGFDCVADFIAQGQLSVSITFTQS